MQTIGLTGSKRKKTCLRQRVNFECVPICASTRLVPTREGQMNGLRVTALLIGLAGVGILVYSLIGVIRRRLVSRSTNYDARSNAFEGFGYTC